MQDCHALTGCSNFQKTVIFLLGHSLVANQLGLWTELFPQATSFLSIIAQQTIHLFPHLQDIQTFPSTECKSQRRTTHCILKLKPNLILFQISLCLYCLLSYNYQDRCTHKWLKHLTSGMSNRIKLLQTAAIISLEVQQFTHPHLRRQVLH